MAISRVSVSGLGDVTRALQVREANMFINSEFVISQENARTASAASAAATYYMADQWNAQWTVSTGTVYVGSTTCSTQGVPYRIYAASSGGITLAAGSYVFVHQPVEGHNCSGLEWGTANAKDIKIGFYTYASASGTATLWVSNSDNTRTYVANFSVTANTLEWHEITVPGDTSGTWSTENTKGLNIGVSCACGSTFQGTNNSWNAGSYRGTSSTSNFLSAASSSFEIHAMFCVPAEVDFPTSANLAGGVIQSMYRDVATERLRCMRYYINYGSWTSAVPMGFTLAAGVPNATGAFWSVPYPVNMRASPTVTLLGASSSGNVQVSGVNRTAYAADVNAQSWHYVYNNSGVTWGDQSSIKFSYIADARM